MTARKLFVVSLLPLWMGCGGADMMEPSSGATTSEARVHEIAHAEESDNSPAEVGEGGDSGGGAVPKMVERKIVYNSSVRIVLKKTSFEEFEKEIGSLVEQHKAYRSNVIFNRNRGENRSGTWEIRVPTDKYTAFLEAVKKLGIPEEVQEKTRDVTAQYVDLEARIANQKKLEERIVGVLDEVKGKIGEVLEVEQQLARVRENIERLEGQMRVLKDQVTMATLTIHVREDKDYVPPQEPSFGDSIGEMWSDSIAALKTFGKGLVLLLVALLPWLLILVPLGFLAFRLIRRWWRNRVAKTPPVLAEGDETA